MRIRRFRLKTICRPQPDDRCGFPRPRLQENNVSKPELGTKRLCAGCAVKFYDLMKDPIVCPKCEAVFIVPKVDPPRAKRSYNLRSAKPVPVVEEPVAAVKTEGEEPEVEDDKDSEGGVALLEDDEEE